MACLFYLHHCDFLPIYIYIYIYIYIGRKSPNSCIIINCRSSSAIEHSAVDEDFNLLFDYILISSLFIQFEHSLDWVESLVGGVHYWHIASLTTLQFEHSCDL